MMISWLENGIKDSLKIQIKRQMKLLSETARTIHNHFLKLWKTNKNYKKNSFYVSPLDKLDKLTSKYQPKKVVENNKYQELYQRGKCDLFEAPPSSYRYYHIHGETPVKTLNDLIDYAKEITHYTVSTATFKTCLGPGSIRI